MTLCHVICHMIFNHRAILLTTRSSLLFTLLRRVDKESIYHQVSVDLLININYNLVNTGDYVHHGVKINTPHYLAKLNGITRGNHSYTVIVSQLDSLSTIYYTMKVGVVLITYL